MIDRSSPIKTRPEKNDSNVGPIRKPQPYFCISFVSFYYNTILYCTILSLPLCLDTNFTFLTAVRDIERPSSVCQQVKSIKTFENTGKNAMLACIFIYKIFFPFNNCC
ncbi:unnamed protein product [Meloidogyne enterolobii]|uniref:Uncharacterized protein n=1 Tax=Meloidogyne enterolobii TaxID=390850 RepID=A0ACB0YM21_MELEN